MITLAHAGVEHATSTESAAHNVNVVMIIAAITIFAILFMILAVYIVKRLTSQTVESKDEDK